MDSENRQRLDGLIEKYGTAERCSKEEDILLSNLAQLERETPGAILSPLKRVHAVLVTILDEEYAANRKSFARLGVDYDPAVHSDGDEILNFIQITIHRLVELVGKITCGGFICAQSPSAVLDLYFDLKAVDKSALSLTLPPPKEVEPIVIPLPPGQTDRHIPRLSKPSDVPGVDFSRQYGGGRDGQTVVMSSDGAFSRQMANIAALPNRI